MAATALVLVSGPSVAAAPAASTATSPAGVAARPAQLTIASASNHKPEYVSGGDVLVEVALPAGIDPRQVTVRRNGIDVTPDFLDQGQGRLLGLVRGLREGGNAIVASGGGQSATLQVTNHPITGPMFSGPQQLPFYCTTEQLGLDPATQPFCHAPTEVRYFYRNRGGDTLPLATPTRPPADVATATVDGQSVPWVIRLETGTIDRAVYQIAALYDGTDPDPLRPTEPWNQRLTYSFGGGCNVGFHQGDNMPGGADDTKVGDGYVVASSTLNVLQTNCNPVISAEAALMVKEHVIETYGPVVHTIGRGGSGGSIQVYGIAENYPGILDGIVPSASFPDPVTRAEVADCVLGFNFLANTDVAFTTEQLEAVSGFANFGTCQRFAQGAGQGLLASQGCDPAVPADAVYDSETNPDGVKCTIAEQNVNILGRNPVTDFANSPYDNKGVQYGRQALTDGAISPEQFVALNEGIGGFDVDGDFVARRSEADPIGVERTYRSGLALNGGQGLASTPIIDSHGYDDPLGNIHPSYWQLAIQKRLVDANGDADNQVLLLADPRDIGKVNKLKFDKMEEWLTAIGNDTSSADPRTKVLQNKPSDLNDACYTKDFEKIVEAQTYPSSGRCGALYPAFGDTRTVAGSPIDLDIMKCQLQPLDFSSYGAAFTPDQRARLQGTFPDGVCDWSKPGVQQQPPAGVWQSYAASAPSPECPAAAGPPAQVRLVYLDLLARCPDPGGGAFWTGFLADGGNRQDFALLVARSPEGRGLVVDRVYDRILDRAPDPGGRAYWSDRLVTDLRYDDFVGSVAASPELWDQSGQDPVRFVDTAYRRILGRSPDQGGLTYWADRIGTGTPRYVVTGMLARSLEASRSEAATAYDVMLRRNPSGPELAVATDPYRATGDRFDLFARRAAPGEFAALAATNPIKPNPLGL